MDPPASGRRGRKRARVSEAEANPNQHQQHNAPVWSQDATVRGADQDTASQHHPAFPSQHVDVSRLSSQINTDPNGLMNGYTTGAPQSQYPNSSPSLAHAPNDVASLAGGQPSVQTPQPSQAQQRRNNVGIQQGTVVSGGDRDPAMITSRIQDSRVLYFNGTGTPATTASIAEPSSAAVSPPPNRSFGLSNLVASWATPIQNNENGTNHTMNTNNTTNNDGTTGIMSQSPNSYHQMQAPQGAIYETFDDLLKSVQASAKEQGFGIVKLRASNYRNNKATRYDLVCDRGGVKYSSTAKKRNPSTRKIDCPWKAKAVCEVQLNNQWRFSVQESHHNHEPRVAVPAPGQDGSPVNQSLRTIVNKIDRLSHDVTASMARSESNMEMRFDSLEKRLESLEALIRSNAGLLGPGAAPNMGNQSMPTANMGGGALGGNGLTNGGITNGGMGGGGMGNGMGSGMGNGMGSGMGNGGMGNGGMGNGMDRMSNLESRVSGLEQVGGMDMSLIDDDPSNRRMPML